MSTWNKVLLGLILFMSLVFIFFAARALKTHQFWRDRMAKYEKDLAAREKENLTLMGDNDAPNAHGLRQVTARLHDLMSNRGRVWPHVTPGGFNAETGALTVTTETASPQGMVGTVLALFSEAAVKDGGSYLGQFTVTSQAEKQLQLQPSQMLTHAEVARLQKSPAPWVMYDIIPADDPESFAGLDEAAKRALLPESTIEEYLNEGTAQPDGTKAHHKFRDYSVLLTDLHRQRTLLFEYLAAAKHDKHYLQNALAGAHKHEQFHNTEINTLKAELAEEERRRVAVVTHEAALTAKLKETQDQIAQLTDANRKLVSDIARIQLEATRLIDQRTQGMAQTSH